MLSVWTCIYGHEGIRKNPRGGKKQRGFTVNSSIYFTDTSTHLTHVKTPYFTHAWKTTPTVLTWRQIINSVMHMVHDSHSQIILLKKNYLYLTHFNKMLFCRNDSTNSYLQVKLCELCCFIGLVHKCFLCMVCPRKKLIRLSHLNGIHAHTHNTVWNLICAARDTCR